MSSLSRPRSISEELMKSSSWSLSFLSQTKYAVLIFLVVQNASLSLFMRQSHLANLKDHSKHYIPSTAVFMSEFLKLMFSVAMCSYDTFISKKIPSLSFWFDNVWIFAIPSLLYYLQNRIIYASTRLLDATTFQLVSQGKIITTALFSVLLLKRKLLLRQWIALCALAIGIAMAQISSASSSSSPSSTDPELKSAASSVNISHPTISFTAQPSSVAHLSSSDRMLGLFMMVLACCMSGFAGILIEREFKKQDPEQSSPILSPSSASILGSLSTPSTKDSSVITIDSLSTSPSLPSTSLPRPASFSASPSILLSPSTIPSPSLPAPLIAPSSQLWIRNTQLCVFSLLLGSVDCYTQFDEIVRDGFFGGYTFWTVATIVCQAMGGIIVALVIKYADNILKGFATSLAIIVGALGAFYFLDQDGRVFSPLFVSGALVVCFSVIYYNTPLSDLMFRNGRSLL